MSRRTVAHCVLIVTGAFAQPQSFTLRTGSMDGGGVHDHAPSQQPNTTSKTLSSITSFQTTFLTATTSAFELTAATNSSTTKLLNHTSSSTCLRTSIIVVTLPNPTPTPISGSSRGEDESEDETILTDDDEADNAGTPFGSASTEPLSKWPHWFTAATFTLVFYDLLTLGVFIWLWVFGYLWWFRRGEARSWRRRGAVSEGSVELGRMELGQGELGGGERTREWVRTGRGYGRVRSESWERVRSARELELEREMARLGMI